MKKIKVVLIIAVFIAFLVLLAVNSVVDASVGLKIYVNNQMLTKIVESRGAEYVDLMEFLTFADMYWQVKGNMLFISKTKGGRSLITKVPNKYFYNGKMFDAHTFMLGGRPLVVARLLSRGMGFEERYTKSVNTIDFYQAGISIPSREVVSSSSTSGKSLSSKGQPLSSKGKQVSNKAKKVTYKDDEIKKSLIQPKIDYFYDWKMGTLRGQVWFENSSSDNITDIKVKLKVVDGDGNPLYTQNYDIGAMSSGEKTKKYDLYWTNPSNYPIFDNSFKYEITYMEPAKTTSK